MAGLSCPSISSAHPPIIPPRLMSPSDLCDDRITAYGRMPEDGTHSASRHGRWPFHMTRHHAETLYATSIGSFKIQSMAAHLIMACTCMNRKCLPPWHLLGRVGDAQHFYQDPESPDLATVQKLRFTDTYGGLLPSCRRTPIQSPAQSHTDDTKIYQNHVQNLAKYMALAHDSGG